MVAPDGVSRPVLDVGCGAGTLARAVAARVPRVDGIDRSPPMIELAGRAAQANVTLQVADALTIELPHGGYDAVLSSSVMHHLPRMAGWLKRGGVLAAVALPRVDLPRELPIELAAIATHQALGLAFAALRPVTGASLFRQEPGHDVMPIADPTLTTREVRARAETALPDVRVRRLLLWRYLLTWRKPA